MAVIVREAASRRVVAGAGTLRRQTGKDSPGAELDTGADRVADDALTGGREPRRRLCTDAPDARRLEAGAVG